MTKILIKRLSKEVPLPKYETNGSSGMDLAANVNTNIDIDPGKYIFEIVIDGSKGEEINITELGIQENLSQNTHKIKKMVSFDEFIKLDFSLNGVFTNYTVKIKQINV